MSEQLTPARIEIIRNALVSAAGEMSETLVQTAYSPLLYDIKDFGVTILSARGEMWAEASGLAVFLGALRGTMQLRLETVSADSYEEGDVYIANCPYLTGTHLSDTAIYMPVFVDGQLVAFAATMAHWADIGGRSPGGWDPSSTDITMEGLRFTHQRLHAAGVPNEQLYELIRSNVRLPRQVMGDLAAQIAACRTAATRITWLCEKYGASTVDTAMSTVITNTRERLRAAVSEAPDGQWAGTQELDFDGVDREYRPKVSVEVDIKGANLVVDLTGSSGPAPGPINCPRIGAESVVLAALKGVFSPHDPTNEGHLSFVSFTRAEEASLIHPSEPAPCDSYGLICRTLVETTIRVMAGPKPERARAGGYQMVGCYVMRPSAAEDDRFTYTEPVPGGYGAFAGSDGSTLVFGGDTPLLPVEIMEARYPLRCEQLSLDLESPGDGEFRGGYGIQRDIRVLEDDCLIKPSFESVKDPLAKGVGGGTAGSATRLEVNWPDGKRDVLNERPEQFAVPAGTLISLHTGGGGGYGPPENRDPLRVLRDVENGLINIDQARSRYQVAISPDGGRFQLNISATEALRSHGDSHIESAL
ncbi:MAG: hydantoinase B/oxoprolinase family protein [Actinobacteria bacterium]|nr:hydantoinase B/oxoprolinase family protein [Actinomycetota bacterium]